MGKSSSSTSIWGTVLQKLPGVLYRRHLFFKGWCYQVEHNGQHTQAVDSSVVEMSY